MMTYKELFTFEHLYQSYITARRSKRHKKDVILFEMNLSYNLHALKEELDNKTYNIVCYNTFKIYEPKERRVDSISFKDRIVQHCLVDFYLMPVLERILIFDNGACRKNKGTDFCRNRLKRFLLDYSRKYDIKDAYVLRMDIHHYFESIYHPILIDELRRYVFDNNILNLCIKIVNSFSISTDRGLPLGNQTSQCFALLFLNRFDRIIKEKYRIKYYVRYMDDCVLLINDKSILNNLLKEIKNYLNSIGLLLNNNKTFVYPLMNNPISFLGFNHYLTETNKIIIKVSNEKYRRFMRYINKHKTSINITNNYHCYLKMREKF